MKNNSLKDTWTKPKGLGSRLESGDDWGKGKMEKTVVDQQ